MRSIAILATLLVAVPQAVLANSHSAGATVAAAALSTDTPIEVLVADARAKVVLDALVPGLAAHPMYESFKAMSLKQIQPMSNGRITDEVLAKAGTELAAIK